MDVSSFLEKNFTNVVVLSKGVFRVQKEYEGNVYQVHYIDESREVLRDDFDIETYQKKFVFTDYYKNNNSLQWNYYIHFICSKQEIKLHQKELKVIEENRRLTRKIVQTEGGFKRLQSNSNLDFNVDSENALSIWAGVLGEEYQVALDTTQTMAGTIRLLVDDQNNSRRAPTKSRKVVPPIEKIGSIDLGEKYRKYPKDRNFSFADVNLITGSNASGKTSLLEAVELIVCGSTKRNPDTNERYKFEVKYENQSEAVDEVRRTLSEYQNRAFSWYGDITRDNNLIDSFSRHNFYDSDSATRFSTTQNSGKDIENALYRIIFGAEAHDVFGHLTKLLSKVEDEKRFKEREINYLSSELTEINRELASRKTAVESSATEEMILESISSNELILNAGESEVSFYKDNIAKILSAIADWMVFAKKFKTNTFNQLNEFDSKIKGVIPKLSKIELTLESFAVDMDSTKSELVRLDRKDREILRIKEYVDSDSIVILRKKPELNKYSTEISLLSGSLRNFDLFSDLVFSEADLQLDFHDLYSHLTELHNESQEDLQSINEKIEKDRANLDLISGIKSNLLSEISRYLEVYPDESQCPVCMTSLKPESLKARISVTFETIDRATTSLNQLLKKLNTISTLSSKLHEKRKNLDVIKEICHKLDRPLDDKISVIIADIRTMNERYEELISIKEVVSQEIKQVENQGYSLDELENLLQSINIKNTEKLRSRIESIKLDNDQRKGNANEKLDKLNHDVAVTQEMNNKLKSILLPEVEFIGSERLTALSSDIDDVLKSILEIKAYVNVRNEEDVFSLQLRMEMLLSQIDSHLSCDAELKAITLLTKKISDNKSASSTLKDKGNKLNKLSVALRKITQDYNPASMLAKHMKIYSKNIGDVFDRIHSPHEFEEIVIEEQKIYLKRSSDEALVPISKLSTGQRSALALSVFISMNLSLKNGPPFLIFDDPVVYVDDLNILSFFDYLREFAVQGKRQIFFATASNKIATLFEKKMDFLSNNSKFKRIELSRGTM